MAGRDCLCRALCVNLAFRSKPARRRNIESRGAAFGWAWSSDVIYVRLARHRSAIERIRFEMLKRCLEGMKKRQLRLHCAVKTNNAPSARERRVGMFTWYTRSCRQTHKSTSCSLKHEIQEKKSLFIANNAVSCQSTLLSLSRIARMTIWSAFYGCQLCATRCRSRCLRYY